MTIDRRLIFTLAWKRARSMADGQPVRPFFAAALRAVWALAKATVVAEAGVKARPVINPAGWERGNVHRARAVANYNARLGSYTGYAGW